VPPARLVGGEEVSKFKDGDDQYSVVLRLDEQFRNNPALMGNLLVPSTTQRALRVSDVAQLSMGSAPASIDRYNRQLAVTFIYMVLGLLALMAFAMTLNVYSAIGMLMLFGIVKKNSILQVDYTNTLRAQGMERHEAIVAANHVRLRPILMTTLSIIAGMLPIAFGCGAGARSRALMAVTILGGQVLCLLLTLLVTPVVYSYFDDLREIDGFALVRRWTSIGVYGRRDSAAQAN
jgi:multidrug efflux pump subunit AcrB